MWLLHYADAAWNSDVHVCAGRVCVATWTSHQGTLIYVLYIYSTDQRQDIYTVQTRDRVYIYIYIYIYSRRQKKLSIPLKLNAV